MVANLPELDTNFIMIVCHCLAKTDKDIISAIANGAKSVREIAEATLATTDCGTCTETIQKLLGESNEHSKRHCGNKIRS